jgi:GxxExxY protein
MGYQPRETIDDLTHKINGCAFKVRNTLGCGFLEKVYENALAWELEEAGFTVEQQVPFVIRYGTVSVGEYFADLVVNRSVIVEVKACEALAMAHKAQAINYLKASGMEAGLLINFGHPRLEIRRIYRPRPSIP